MTTGRVEAFSDGVIAIIITIMVLELRPPHDATIASLRPSGSAYFHFARKNRGSSSGYGLKLSCLDKPYVTVWVNIGIQ